VACLLKARTVEPEKQSLLANGCETTFVYRQRLGKHVSAATVTRATIQILLLETVFSTRSVRRVYKEDSWQNARLYFVNSALNVSIPGKKKKNITSGGVRCRK
jgi:hypothetical protein